MHHVNNRKTVFTSLTVNWSPDYVRLRTSAQFQFASVLSLIQQTSSQIISGSAPAVQPTNRGRAESRDVDAKRRI